MRGGPWLRARIRTHLERWVPELGLTPWTISVHFRPKGKEAKEIAKRADAYVNVTRKRMSAHLGFNLTAMARDAGNDQEVEEIVVHELVHIVANTDERETNALARALVRARRGV